MHYFQTLQECGLVLLILTSSSSADDRELLKPLVEKALKAGGGQKLRSAKAWTFTEKVRGRTTTYRQ